MNIPLVNLTIAFIPVAVALVIYWHWGCNSRQAGLAVSRMLAQLLLIGYVLNYIFAAKSGAVVLAVLTIMLLASSWIAAGSGRQRRPEDVGRALIAIAVPGIVILLLITQGVLRIKPWYHPGTVIPLAGMIFAAGMNTVSLAAERIDAEIAHGAGFENARAVAFAAALIPNINAMLAVGLVSLPGMMTGQILSGVSPLVAVRYQIMVMCMIFSTAAIAAACYLSLYRHDSGKRSSVP